MSRAVEVPTFNQDLTHLRTGKTYTIKKRITFNEDWSPVGGAFPPGGAVDENLTFTDPDALFDSQSFYYVVENP